MATTPLKISEGSEQLQDSSFTFQSIDNDLNAVLDELFNVSSLIDTELKNEMSPNAKAMLIGQKVEALKNAYQLLTKQKELMLKELAKKEEDPKDLLDILK